MIGYNYRLPNLNAALGCAQIENLSTVLLEKRNLALLYQNFFKDKAVHFVKEPNEAKSNYWLNALIFNSAKERNEFLEESNKNGVMTRPIWKLMNSLPMFASSQLGDLENSVWLQNRVVNIPSSVRK